jgi:carbon-monoxide dehydrogenase medium subunit
MKPPRFSYVRAESLDHACRLLAEHGDEARILAGGQSLMPTLNMRLSRPKLLVDINRIAELEGVSLTGDEVRIGALTRHADVMNSDVVKRQLPLIAEAIHHVAHVAVRNRGTFGGSVALADPAAEMPACLLALGGRVVLQSTRGRREVPAEDYFLGLYQTAREVDEVLVEARIPVQSSGFRSSFKEIARRHGDFAMAGVAALASLERGTFERIRLVYFGTEVKPLLAVNAMSAAEGKPCDAATMAAVCAALASDLDPMDNNIGTPATKLHWQQVLTKRALAELAGQEHA